ncbi:MAG: hypothetical protein WD355_00025 [Balneolaceae bacterium]
MIARVGFYTLCMLFALLLTGCSDNPVETDVKESADPITGYYYLYGIEIDRNVCWLPISCEPGEEISRDTTEIDFWVYIKPLENYPDTLQFYGLKGGNAGDLHQYCTAAHGNCSFAILVEDSLYFDLLSSSGRFTGSGTLKEGSITLQTSNAHRGDINEYQLEGLKIDTNGKNVLE